jgi:hypothetical protein
VEPTGWEVGRNSESVRVFRRKEIESCYQIGGDDDDDDDDNDEENCVMSIIIYVHRQTE